MPRKIIFSLLIIFAIIVAAKFALTKKPQVYEPDELPTVTTKLQKYPDENLLGKEKSPYLLQHKDNPVHWYPWGDAAFAKAKAEDKPVFLSIGYSTCHWCHVMEHESFENSEIADILNKYFVAIKVDREERPDLDNIYMKAVMALTGSGGWPLSAFLTPDRKPFYGGTYFPPEARWGQPGFKELLLSIHNGWMNQRKQVIESSESITQALQNNSSAKAEGKVDLGPEVFDKAFRYYTASFDSLYGGFGGSPKFPSTHNLSFLLRYWKRNNDPKALEMAEKTLIAMAKGGMYDHLGGGFHRYSTDQKWHVPHFEKMLYDQAIIAQTYLEAYQATKNVEYARVAREIFEYVLRDMTDQNGGFYSAEDADSLESQDAHEKKEGAFYVWADEEIAERLGKNDAEIFNYYYGAQKDGNAEFDPHGEFTGKNILFAAHNIEEAAKQFNKSVTEVNEILTRSKQKMLDARSNRPRPHLDDKILVDWNGLMISSLAFGSAVLQEPRYAEAAEKAATFISNSLVRKDGRLLHRFRDGEAAILGSIEDYAFFVHGLIDLYQATFKVTYLKEAKRLTEEMLKLFWDTDRGGFFFIAADAEQLLYREKEIYDGAIPSGNAFAALDLLRLGRLTLNTDWEKRAEELFRAFGSELSQSPMVYSQSLSALDFALGPSKEIVIVGNQENKETGEMLKLLYSYYLPNKVVILRPLDIKEAQDLISIAPFIENQSALKGVTTAYVCEDYQCKFPATDISQFENLLK